MDPLCLLVFSGLRGMTHLTIPLLVHLTNPLPGVSGLRGMTHLTISLSQILFLVFSGLRGMTLLKTTQSGFANFHTDEFRALPDTHDRSK
jgi:hypothetical protein